MSNEIIVPIKKKLVLKHSQNINNTFEYFYFYFIYTVKNTNKNYFHEKAFIIFVFILFAAIAYE